MVASTAGLRVSTQSLFAIDTTGIDTVLAIGGAHEDGDQRQAVAGWLARAGCGARRICGIGRGVDLLNESGLVTRADSALHWRRGRSGCGDPRRSPIASRHNSIWTCAGGTAAIDLSLALVAEDLGEQTALELAETLLMFVWRHPEDAQVSDTLRMQIRGGAPFRELLHRMRSNIAGDLRVERLAEWCNMSPRTFARRFVKATGTTPAAAATAMRVEVAAALSKSGGLSLKQVAARSGFGCELSMRRAFERSNIQFPSRDRGSED
jgi:transcriptional regulator GlxA family with amidase domain